MDSQARVSGATGLPAAVLPTIASETGALPPVWARRVCAWMLIPLCRFCCCLINWRNTRITMKWVALLFFYLYQHLKGPGKQFTLSTSKKNWNSMLWHKVILQINLKYSFSKLSLLLSLKKKKRKERKRKHSNRKWSSYLPVAIIIMYICPALFQFRKCFYTWWIHSTSFHWARLQCQTVF